MRLGLNLFVLRIRLGAFTFGWELLTRLGAKELFCKSKKILRSESLSYVQYSLSPDSSVVEHLHGKQKVVGPIPILGKVNK